MQVAEKAKFKNIFISSAGGLLEMYDFTIYAFFAAIISQLFFPKTAGTFVALLSTFAILATGYLVRPIGAALFGHFGDRVGRKSMLLWSVAVMGIATTCIGLLPTWQSIGILAPILLLLLRILQGVAVGGDLPGAITFVAEHAEPVSRGLDCAWIYLAVNIGLLMAMAATAFVSAILPHYQLVEWGWRIVFLSGLLIGVVAFYLRVHMKESVVFVEKQKEQTLLVNPLKVLWQSYKASMLKAVAIMVIGSIVIGHLLYLPTYFHLALGLSFRKAALINAGLIFCFSLLVPLFGFLSDRLGRRKILFFGAFCFLIFSIPVYLGFQSGHGGAFFIAVAVTAILSASVIGVFPSLLSELFPTEVRYSGLALGYNISFAIFCGTTPMIMTVFFHFFKNPIAPSFYIMLGALISMLPLFFMKETKALDLREV